MLFIRTDNLPFLGTVLAVIIQREAFNALLQILIFFLSLSCYWYGIDSFLSLILRCIKGIICHCFQA